MDQHDDDGIGPSPEITPVPIDRDINGLEATEQHPNAPDIGLAEFSLPLCLIDQDSTILWANASFWGIAPPVAGASPAAMRLASLLGAAADLPFAESAPDFGTVVFPNTEPPGRRYELRTIAVGPAPFDGAPQTLLMAAIDIEERCVSAEIDAALRLELGHRLRNVISVVSSLVNNTLGRHDDHGAVARLLDRLRSLQNAGYVGDEVFESVCVVGRVARRILDRFHDPDDRRVRMEGDDVVMSRPWSNTLALILHELATNSVKHGALSAAAGTVTLRWCALMQTDVPTLHIEWRDVGGPSVTEPVVRGQGLAFIENILRCAKDAQVVFRFPPTGFVCQLDLPLDRNIQRQRVVR